MPPSGGFLTLVSPDVFEFSWTESTISIQRIQGPHLNTTLVCFSSIVDRDTIRRIRRGRRIDMILPAARPKRS
jgi:hypothetical protein